MTDLRTYPEPIDGLSTDHDGPILRLRIDRPERRNAITDDIVLGLIELIEVAGSDESVRVIHLSGTGEHFCSGFDLSLRGNTDDKPRTGATQRQMRWHVNRLIPSMLETQTPIVIWNMIQTAATQSTKISLGRCGARVSQGCRRISHTSISQ